MRVAGGNLCEAEAPTEPAGETVAERSEPEGFSSPAGVLPRLCGVGQTLKRRSFISAFFLGGEGAERSEADERDRRAGGRSNEKTLFLRLQSSRLRPWRNPSVGFTDISPIRGEITFHPDLFLPL